MRRLFPMAALLACLWAPVAAHAQARLPEDPRPQVMLSGDVVVTKGRVVGEVVVLHGTATIQGVVDGDVVVLDGPIVVAGQVSGAVVAVDGDVTLQSTAQVVGDVIAGGSVRVADGATVEGTIREDVDFSLAGPLAALGALLASVAVAVSVLLMLLLLVLLAPRGAERV
ncbi:MAG TPA: polymer-forming cytoskeletal protein, partial [Actinomycetota bacterium]